MILRYVFIYLAFYSISFGQNIVTLVSGSLNGDSVESGILEVFADPLDTLEGAIAISVTNTHCPNCVAPLVKVWSWGNHQQSYSTIDSWVPIGTFVYNLPISLITPESIGVYFLVFSYRWEMNGAQVASLTNWQVPGNPHWNDGHDIADWGLIEYNQSINEHSVYTFYEYVSGWDSVLVPSAIIRINNGVGSCDYEVGDVNGDWILNGLDVIYGVNYLKGTGPPPWCFCECESEHFWYVCGDVNSTCTYNGLDIVYAVAYLKGLGPAPVPCLDCPPYRASNLAVEYDFD